MTSDLDMGAQGAAGLESVANSYVLEETKTAYISVAGAVDTLLRKLIAELQGEDLAAFRRVLVPYPTRLDTVHGRHAWQRTPSFDDVSPQLRQSIAPENGWFIFTVVGDPWTRLWSAWQTRLLARVRRYHQRYGGNDWYPHLPSDQATIVADFRRFVDVLADGQADGLFRDPKFGPQAKQVRPKRVAGTRVYDVTAVPGLLADLTAHRAEFGRPEPLRLDRAPKDPLVLISEVLDDGVDDKIAALYRRDIKMYGADWDIDVIGEREGPWSDDALRAVRYRCAVHERVGDLSVSAQRVRQYRKSQSANQDGDSQDDEARLDAGEDPDD